MQHLPPIDLPAIEKFRQVCEILNTASNSLVRSIEDTDLKPLLWFFIICTMKMEYFSLNITPSRDALRHLDNWFVRLIQDKSSPLFQVEPWIKQTLSDACPPYTNGLIECVNFEFYTLLCERLYRALEDIDPNTLSVQQQQEVQIMMELLEYKKLFIDFEIQTGRPFMMSDLERQIRSEEENKWWAQQQIQENLRELEALQPSEPIYVGPLVSERRLASEVEFRKRSQRRQRSRLYREQQRGRNRRSRSRTRRRSRSRSRSRRRRASRTRSSGSTPAQAPPVSKPSSGDSRPSKPRHEESRMCIMM